MDLSMASVNNENVIEDIMITHFINPSMFWYRISTEFPEELFNLERELLKHFAANRNKEYVPKVNEIVAVYIISESRYCRAKVEKILEYRSVPNKYMIWAMDYGKVYSTHSKFIRELPHKLADINIENIFFGGLNKIVPAKQIFDFRKYANVMEVCEKWSPESCKLFDDIVKDAYILEFVVQRKIKDQYFGELKASIQTNNKISVNDILIKSNGAMESDSFTLILKDFKLNERPFWLTNENDISKYNQNIITTDFLELNKIDSNTSKPINEPNENEKKGCNLNQHEDESDEEVDLYKKINEWNLGNSVVISNDKTEKLFKLRNTKDESLISENLEVDKNTTFGDMNLNDSIKKTNLEHNISQNVAEHKNRNLINDNGTSEKEILNTNPFGLKNVSLKSQSNESSSDRKSFTSETSADDSRKSARQKILARVKNRSKPPVFQDLSQSIVVPAGYDMRNLQQKKIERPPARKSLESTSTNENLNYPSSSHKFQTESFTDISNKKVISDDSENQSSISMSDSINDFLQKYKDEKSIIKSTAKTSCIRENSEYQEPLSAFEIQPLNHHKSSNILSNEERTLRNSLDSLPKNLNTVQNTKSEFSQISSNISSRQDERNRESGSGSHNERRNENIRGDIQVERKNENRFGNINDRKSEYSQNNKNSNKIEDPYVPKRNDNQANRNNNRAQNPRTYSDRSRLTKLDETCIPISNIGKHSVMVHGNVPVPIKRLAEAQFTPYIHNQMEMLGYKAIYRVQEYCWPHLLRFNSLILVNGEKSGKTLSYLPVICSLIEMENENDVNENERGPMAIIILSSRGEAEQLTRLCKYFTKKVVFCSDQNNSAEALSLLLNPVNILICTPNGIQELVEKNKKYRWFFKDRIKHFVIENIDIWSHEKLKILNEAMDSFSIKKLSNIQIIVTSRIWTKLLNNFLKLKSFDNPLICMGACIEAAVYSNTQFILRIIQNDLKVKCVLDFLQKNFYEDEKTIIICNSDDDVQFLADKIRGFSLNVLFCTSQSSLDDINSIKSDYNNYTGVKRSVLVCSDSVLPDLTIHDAQNLIHYSLSLSWTQTCYRFSVFLRYYEDRLLVNNKIQIYAEPKKDPTKTLFLLDESNNEQLPKLISFLERNKILIDESIRKLIKRIEIEHEKNQNLETRPFCSKFLEFAKYHDITQCKGRHILTKNDAPYDDIPVDGEIKFQIISIETPTLFYVRILEHKEINSNLWHYVKQSNMYATFFMKFNMYFCNTGNHQTYFPIVQNEICVAVDKGQYYRCKILEIKKIEVNGTVDFNVRAKLVDLGSIMTFKSSQLLVLPKKFTEFPFQAVELRLLGIVPYDKEESWDKKTVTTIRKWFEMYSNDKNVFNTSTVDFALMNTILVKEIVIKTELSALKTEVGKIYIKRNLIDKKMVLKDTQMENDIKLMAYEVGLLMPSKSQENINSIENINKVDKSNTTINNCKTVSQINSSDVVINKMDKNVINESRVSGFKETWINLVGNTFSRILITLFKSPDNFFILNRNSYIDSKLENLSMNIEKFIKSGAKNIIEPRIGLNCLAKFEDEFYKRGKIIGLSSENFQLVVTVFFVDFGLLKKMNKKYVFETTEIIVNMLPFQAIQCSLVGISSKTLDDNWSKEESQFIYEKFIKNCDSLHVRPMLEESQQKRSILKYCSYKVILVDSTNKKNLIQINSVLYASGLATKDPDSEHFMDLAYCVEKDFDNLSECSDTSIEEWKMDEDHPEFKYTDLKTKKNSEHEFEINFDEAELEDFLESFGLPKTTKILPPEKSTTENPVKMIKHEEKKIIQPKVKEYGSNLQNSDKSKFNKEIKEDTQNLLRNPKTIIQLLKEKRNLFRSENQNSADSISLKRVPELKNNYKIPKVVWRQNENLIFLYIYAPNVEDYGLKVTQTNLLFSADIEDNLNVLCLNLFGSIDFVSHEIRGLSVVIRLIKTIKGKAMIWPRLTKETDKHLWLKYNYDSLLNENYSNASLEFANNDFKQSDDDNSVLSEEDYENFGKVFNAEDIYDPLADI